jgi:hypothetical protein
VLVIIARDYGLTNSMEQRLLWEAGSRAAAQEIPFLLCNPKDYYGVHKSPPLDSILSQSTLANHITSRSILVLSFPIRTDLLNGLFCLGFPTKTMYACVLHVLPFSFSVIWAALQYLVEITNYEAPHHVIFSFSRYLLSLIFRYSPQHPVLKHSHLCSSSKARSCNSVV